MKSFIEFVLDDGAEQLDEGFVRASALTAYAAQARANGERSRQAFQVGLQALQQSKPTDEIETRLQRIENALDAALRGLQFQRDQIGSAASLSFAGHTLATRGQPKR